MNPEENIKTVFLNVSDRVYLKGLTGQDISEDYVSWLNDKEITDYLETGRFPVSPDEIVSFVEECNKGNDVLLGIIDSVNDKHIGNIRLGPIYWRHSRADMGIVIGDKSCWGKGIASEVIKVVVDYAFDQLGLRKISLDVVEFNKRAVKMYENLGFKREAVFRDHRFKDGKFWDVYLYGLLQEDYKKRR